jgi:hypothetical protein
MRYLLFCLFFILIGCASPEQQVRIQRCSDMADAHNPIDRIGNSVYWSCLKTQEASDNAKKQIANDNYRKDRCFNYGFKPGTDNFAQCVMSLERQDAINAQNQQALDLQRQQMGLQQLNNAANMLAPKPVVTCFHAPNSPVTTCQ